VKEASQTRLSRRLAARLLPTRTHRAQGEGGIGRGRGTDTPRAKSVTNTIYRQKFVIFITNVRRVIVDQPMRTYWNSTQVDNR
jgi:hypothetical protein